MNKTDWQNIIQCIDLAVRQTGLQNIEVLVPLAAKVKAQLDACEPKPEPPKE